MDPREVSARTIGHYDRHAEAYFEHTSGHAVEETRAAFLRHLPGGGAPCDVLDLGCGTGRDLLHFRSLGHRAVGLDGSRASAAIAERRSGCPVRIGDLLALELPEAAFDGVFANAVLFHVPPDRLPGVLGQLRRTLRPGGVFLACNPRGADEAGWFEDRYVCLYAYRTWMRAVRGAGFVPVEHFWRPPGLPRRRQDWLVTVWRRAPDQRVGTGGLRV